MSEEFTGDKKRLNHFLLNYERKIIAACLPLVPSWISTVHLTLMTILWSAGVVFFGYLSNCDIRWLWAFSVCIFFQHITDMLDGEVGRMRRTGLIEWGFYADHFLDYVFLCAIVIGYSFLLPPVYSLLVLLHLAVTGGFMIHVFLDFAITKDFKISFNRFGVSEIRYALIFLNVLLIFFGKELFIKIFPLIVSICFLGLVFLVYKSQKIYRIMDMNRLGQKPDGPLSTNHPPQSSRTLN